MAFGTDGHDRKPLCNDLSAGIRRTSLSRREAGMQYRDLLANSHRGLPPCLPLLKNAEEAGALLLRIGEPAKTARDRGE